MPAQRWRQPECSGFDRHQIILSLELCGPDSYALTRTRRCSSANQCDGVVLYHKPLEAENAEIPVLWSLAAAIKWKVSQHQALIARCQSGTSRTSGAYKVWAKGTTIEGGGGKAACKTVVFLNVPVWHERLSLMG